MIGIELFFITSPKKLYLYTEKTINININLLKMSYLQKYTREGGKTRLASDKKPKSKKLINRILPLFLILVLFAPLGMRGQETLTVYENTTDWKSGVPVDFMNCGCYLKAEYVVPSSELTVMNNAALTSLKFYCYNTMTWGGSDSFQVFLKEVQSTTLSNFAGTAGATIVYQGTLGVNSNNEMVVNFTTNYTYQGGNLLIGFYKNGNSASDVYNWWDCVSVTGAAVYGNSSSSLDNITPTQFNYVPKTTFTYTSSNFCSQPTNLQAELTGNDGTIATLSWTENGDATNWVLEYGTVSDFTSATSVNVSVTPSKQITGLTAGTTYYARVKADCGGSQSNWSDVAVFTPSFAKPLNLAVSDVTVSGATLSWTAPNENVLNYQYQYKAGEGEWMTLASTNQTSVNLTGLEPATTYTFQVQAAYAVGTSDFASTTFTTNSSCERPTNFTANAVGDMTYATLTWKENGEADSWVLQYDTDNGFSNPSEVTSGFVVNGTIVSCTLTGLTEQTYYARVKPACDTDGALWSSTVSFKPAFAMLTLNTNTSTTGSEVPIYGYQAQNGASSQFVIPAEGLESMIGSTIKRLTFPTSNSQSNWGDARFEVYVTEVDYTTFSNPATLVDWNTMTQVYSGSLGVSSNKMIVVLDEGFLYEGGNLMIGFKQTATGTSSSVSWWGIQGTSYNGVLTTNSGTYLSAFNPTIWFSYIPTAYPRVASIEQGTITSTTATFSWTAPSTNVTGYAYQYKLASAADWPSAWTSLNAAVVTLQGLSPATDYVFRVKAIYGEHESVPNIASFKTECAEFADVPFVENFDSYTAGVAHGLPYCWNYLGTSSYNPSISSGGNAHSGDNYLSFSKYSSDSEQYAILPQMQNVNGLRVRFFARRAYSSSSSITVGLMTDPTDDATFQAIETFELSTVHQKYKVSFSTYTGGSGYIVFKTGSSYCQACIDDVTVEPLPSCEEPEELDAYNVGAHAATFRWTDSGNPSAWQIYVSTDNVMPAEPVAANLHNVNSNPATLSGLAPETTYYAWVRSSCGTSGEYSPWSDLVSFTTAIACPQDIYIYNPEGSDLAATYVRLSWYSEGQETAWQICLNNDEDHLIDATSKSYTITGLTPSTEYSVKVRANCGAEDGYSSWSSERGFTTDLCDPENKCSISFTANFEYGEGGPVVKSGGTEIAWLSLYNGSGELELCPGEYDIVWQGNGGGSFAIYGADGNVIYSTNQADTLVNGQVLVAYNHVCQGVCFPPKNLNVTAYSTSAIFTWEPGGEETEWKVQWGEEYSQETVTVGTTEYTMENLTPGAAYKVRVKAVCGQDDESGWKETTFTTPLCDDACRIRYTLGSQYGNGWYNAYIRVVDNNGMEVAQLTFDNGYSLEGFLPLCPNETYRFMWVSGNYDSQCSFTIYGSDGEMIVSHEAGDTFNTPLATYEHDCEGCDAFVVGYDTPYVEDFNNTCWYMWNTIEEMYGYHCDPQPWYIDLEYGRASVSPGCFTSSYLALRPVKVTPTTRLTFRTGLTTWLDGKYGTSSVLVSTDNGHSWNYVCAGYESDYYTFEGEGDVLTSICTKSVPLGDYAQYESILVCFKYQGFSNNNGGGIFAMFVDQIRIYDPNVFNGNSKSASWSNANNWSQDVPEEGDDVLINGDCDLDTNPAELNSLVVNEGKTLTIQSGKTLVSDLVSTTDASQLVVEDGAQLKHNNPGTLATVEKEIAPYTVSSGLGATDGWYLISSPLDNSVELSEVTNLVSSIANNYDLYCFNTSNPNGEWLNLKAHSDESDYQYLWPWKGYLYANNSNSPAPVTLQFAGAINFVKDPAVMSIYNNTSNEDFGTWNLVGNPFVREVYPIYGEYVSVGGDKLKSGDSEWLDYGIMPYYHMNSARTGIIVAESGEAIQPGEGVFMQNNSDYELNVRLSTEPYDENVGGDEMSFVKGTLTLNLTKDRGAAIDRAIIRFGEGPTLGKLMLNPDNTKVSIPQGGEEFAVVRSACEGEIPVNFKVRENGSYTLGVNVADAEMEYLHLVDNLAGADVDLLVTPVYTFNAETTDYASRFKLVFKANQDVSSTGSETFAFFNGSTWTVSNMGEATLQVIDMTGRILSSETINGNAEANIQAATGVYLLRLMNDKEVKVQKIVLR